MKTKLLLSSILSLYFSLLSSQIPGRFSYKPVYCNGSALVSLQGKKENEPLIKDNFYGSIGPGLFSSSYYGGFSLYTGFTWSRDKYKEVNSKTHHSNLSMTFRVMNYLTMGNENTSGQKLHDFSLLCGTSLGNIIRFRISGGFGLLNYFRTIMGSPNPNGPPAYNNVYFNTLTVPLEAGLDILFSKIAGLGICGFTEFNSRCTISGINIKLSIGTVRQEMKNK